MDENLKWAYQARKRGKISAVDAIAAARRDLATGKRFYGGSWAWARKTTNPPFSKYGEKHLRWIEDLDVYFRDVQPAHKANPYIGHTGWYTRFEDYDSMSCGIVCQLPGRDGKPQYVAGFSDEDNEGAGCISFDRFFADDTEAARAADRLAEMYAEQSREYDEAWHAGARWADLGREVSEERRGLLEVLKEGREARRTLAGTYPKLCEAIVSQVRAGLLEIRKARKEQHKLFDTYGREEAFADGKHA